MELGPIFIFVTLSLMIAIAITIKLNLTCIKGKTKITTKDHSPVVGQGLAIGHVENLVSNVTNTSVSSKETEEDPTKKSVQLSALVTATKPIIYHESFEDKELDGPAVIYLMGGVTLRNCSFSVRDTKALFIEIPDEWTSMAGVVGIQDCVFERCAFNNIIIAAKKIDIEEIKRGFRYQ